MPSRMTLKLGRKIDTPRRARCALADFDAGLPPEREEAAALLLSELVTNAVKYGGHGPVRVDLSCDEARFRAEVVDQGKGLDFEPRDTDDLGTPGGWGLHLVDTLADRWGSYRGSTHVWFEINRG